jgi:hypothetical protein
MEQYVIAARLQPGEAAGCSPATRWRPAVRSTRRQALLRSRRPQRVRRLALIAPATLDDLIAALRDRGVRVLGPMMRDGASVYDELGSGEDLPIGWTDFQDGGRYRLERRDDNARFGYAVGPHSWRRFLFPIRIGLWRGRTNGDGLPAAEEEPLNTTPLEFVGILDG